MSLREKELVVTAAMVPMGKTAQEGKDVQTPPDRW